MVAHARDFSPARCQLIGDKQLHVAVHLGIQEALGYGFTRHGPVQFYLDLTLLFGSGVGNDPQYPWIAQLLHAGNASDQMARAEGLHDRVTQYLNSVHGPANQHTIEALRQLARLRTYDILPHTGGGEGALLDFLETVFPKKISHTSRSALHTLLEAATEKTTRYTQQHNVHMTALLTTLMFSFGHKCDDDPLYPWIGETLQQHPSSTSASTVELLERRFRLWLRAFLDLKNQPS